MKLALFDFDGTLTTKDSLSEFIKFAVGSPTYYSKLTLFSPIFFLYKIKLMDNSYAKELLFKLFFSGISEQKFKQLAQAYADERLDTIRRDEIYEIFLKHIKDGDRVVVVSASIKCWLEPWTSKHNVELLCTELAFENGKFNGKFQTKNCHGREKLIRVRELLNPNDYEDIYTYGDSSGDNAILSIANHPYKVIT